MITAPRSESVCSNEAGLPMAETAMMRLPCIFAMSMPWLAMLTYHSVSGMKQRGWWILSTMRASGL